MAVAAMANGTPKLCYSYSSPRLLLKPTKKKLMNSPKFFLNTRNPSSNASLKGPSPFPIRVNNSTTQEDTSTTETSNGIPQEVLNYLWKLGAASVAAAVVIKYILFPQITRPNILLALFMVSTPVILAILILIKQSSK